MKTVLESPALIGVDWGTSSFRASLMDRHGNVVETCVSDAGILSVPKGGFEEYFNKQISSWLQENPELPVVLSGMITSRNGWVETPYLPMPLSAAVLAENLTQYVTRSGFKLHFVTGTARNPAEALPDVMRGEETELVGHLAQGKLDTLHFLMPGTHCKWVRTQGDTIVDFETCMTGEIYSVMLRHSILGRLAQSGPFQPEAFAAGLTLAKADSSLLRKLFSARSLALFERLAPTEIADYLSGVLIGDEFSGMMRSQHQLSSLVIVGRGDLALRYKIAAEHFGLAAEMAPPGMANRGHLEIATCAGLI